MGLKNSKPPCLLCNPIGAQEGELCDQHRKELHDLEHRYEGQFRLKRTARGKDHETYDIFLQSQCEPCGRVFLQETDPDNLVVTLLVAEDLQLDTVLPEYDALGMRRTWGDLLRDKVGQELIYSWYGNARACVELFLTDFGKQEHWDVEPRDPVTDEDPEAPADPHSHGGGKHSVH
jgi:hypothetical protein